MDDQNKKTDPKHALLKLLSRQIDSQQTSSICQYFKESRESGKIVKVIRLADGDNLFEMKPAAVYQDGVLFQSADGDEKVYVRLNQIVSAGDL